MPTTIPSGPTARAAARVAPPEPQPMSMTCSPPTIGAHEHERVVEVHAAVARQHGQGVLGRRRVEGVDRAVEAGRQVADQRDARGDVGPHLVEHLARALHGRLGGGRRGRPASGPDRSRSRSRRRARAWAARAAGRPPARRSPGASRMPLRWWPTATATPGAASATVGTGSADQGRSPAQASSRRPSPGTQRRAHASRRSRSSAQVSAAKPASSRVVPTTTRPSARGTATPSVAFSIRIVSRSPRSKIIICPRRGATRDAHPELLQVGRGPGPRCHHQQVAPRPAAPGATGRVRARP